MPILLVPCFPYSLFQPPLLTLVIIPVNLYYYHIRLISPAILQIILARDIFREVHPLKLGFVFFEIHFLPYNKSGSPGIFRYIAVNQVNVFQGAEIVDRIILQE